MNKLSFSRYFVVISSIFILLAVMSGFALAPSIGFPLDHEQSYLVTKQVTPVFIAYLGQCAYYVTRPAKMETVVAISERWLLPIVAVAPFVIFACVFSAVVFSFWVSNDLDAAPGTGMTFARLTDWIAILIGLFTATVSILTAWMFGSGAKEALIDD